MPRTLTSLKKDTSMKNVLNYVRDNASAEYQKLVPIATDENLLEVGKPIVNFEGIRNEFISALMNRIGIVEVKNRSYTNPLAKFKKGMMEYGSTIEEIFIDIAKEYNFMPSPKRNDLADLYEKHDPIVQSRFHTVNRQKYYPVTVEEVHLKRAFLSFDGLESFIAGIINSLYTADAYHEFEIMKSMVAWAIQNNKFYNVKVPVVKDESSAKTLVKKIRAYSNSLTFLSRSYNPAGVATNTLLENQILLMDPNVEAEIGVEVLSAAFNVSQADYLQRRVLIDSFGDKTTQALLISEEWFMVYDTLFEMRQAPNGLHLYTNNFLHHHQLLSCSDFENQIRFSTEEEKAVVTDIYLLPSEAVTIPKGTVQQFYNMIMGVGNIDRAVTYSIKDADKHEDTNISPTGLLSVSPDEARENITVVVTSVQDTKKTAEVMVTLIQPIIGLNSNNNDDTVFNNEI